MRQVLELVVVLAVRVLLRKERQELIFVQALLDQVVLDLKRLPDEVQPLVEYLEDLVVVAIRLDGDAWQVDSVIVDVARPHGTVPGVRIALPVGPVPAEAGAAAHAVDRLMLPFGQHVQDVGRAVLREQVMYFQKQLLLPRVLEGAVPYLYDGVREQVRLAPGVPVHEYVEERFGEYVQFILEVAVCAHDLALRSDSRLVLKERRHRQLDVDVGENDLAAA